MLNPTCTLYYIWHTQGEVPFHQRAFSVALHSLQIKLKLLNRSLSLLSAPAAKNQDIPHCL